MKKTLLVTLCLVILLISVQARKTSRSRSSGSGRGTSRKTSNPQPVPTSFSNPQASAPKPTLFGWQEKPKNSQTYTSQSKPANSQSHGYPSSNTGLSGNSPAKQPPAYSESVQRSNSASQNTAQRAQSPSQTNSQPGHSYPASNGLSGSSGSAGYPQGTGLSGSGSAAGHGSVGYPQSSGGSSSGVGYPQGSGLSGAGGAPPPYPGYKPGANTGGSYPSQAVGNGYHQQGPPPPYSGSGYNPGGYGGYGGHSGYGGQGGYGGHGYNPSYGNQAQMPGYFGNYGGYGKGGFGGVSRSGSALRGIGIAGAGVGTILTGLALWNLARSTGHHHHTVIYDNRGQPVAVAPANGTEPVIDPILKDLVNCTLTISGENSTEVLAIPCAIATSFTPEADVKEVESADGKADNTKCIVTVVTKTGKEFMTTIPCSILLNSAAENNVTEPVITENTPDILNGTLAESNNNGTVQPNQPSALRLTGDVKNGTNLMDFNCESVLENGEVRDPINPCFAVTSNLTVIPLSTSVPSETVN
ncbi:PE-PGRS family protein PE_PGRS18-like [Ostrinia nubilalis]|uniref:uncharacterized protein LOC114350213 n=1 Tax=Ostrinia furnacalis TaxID=93504 RepID=UPI00103E9F98|nr:uncharacterized protein LOC114350213 [Ostrinia furnacalis]